MSAHDGLCGAGLLSLLWGSSFVLIKIASHAFDPFDFALARDFTDSR
jgi:drug/metabolite transporter (DMT)-like permease